MFDDRSNLRQFVLRVVNIETHKEERSLVRNRPCSRYTWNPDGRRIAFFCSGGESREFFLWNLDTGKLYQINVPWTRGATWVVWSPNGRYLAYKSANKSGITEFVVVDADAFSVFRMPLPKSASVISWAPDSERFALLDSNQPNSLEVIDLRGQLLGSWKLPSDIKAKSVLWAPRSERLVVSSVTQTPHQEKIGLFNLKNGHFEALAVLQNHLYDVLWAPNEESVYYQDDLPEGRPIYRLHLGSRRVQSVGLSGFSEMRGITSDSKVLIEMHRSTRPEAWYRVWLEKGREELIYQQTSPSLPEIPAHTVWINSLDNFRIPLIEYRTPKPLSPPAAVIYCHGGRGGFSRIAPMWYPVDGAHILLREGVDYLSVNFRGSGGYGNALYEAGNPETSTQDILAAVGYVHNTLKVPYERIALFGDSTGASLVLGAARQEPTHIGIVFLAALQIFDESILNHPYIGHPRRIILVHPKDDSNSLAESRKIVEKALGPEATNKAVFSEYEVDDEHQLINIASWAAMDEVLLRELKPPTINTTR
ncbi:MAG TPA: prolyl oligopeptidase family serine peptidase [Acidobacteriaceae bacterium]|nr:prolyl oligopeptidase family serine peptidase [Acidobacteriaceae bacterium]